MTATNINQDGQQGQQDTTPPPAERFDASVVECLEAARGLAQLTRFPLIHSSHIVLALAGKNRGLLEGLFNERFSGLQPATISESLLGVLEIEADLTGTQAGDFPGQGAPGEEHLSSEATAVLQRAESLAAEWGREQVDIQALACAIFEKPESFIIEAFQDAGVKASDLADLAGHLAANAAQSMQAAEPPAIFSGEVLNLESFGPVTKIALRMLADLSAAQPDRGLRDADLLHCLLSQEDSLLAEALHVMGIQVASVKRYLQTTVGVVTSAKDTPDLPEKRLGRLLRRIFQEAASLAGRENCTVVAESHLVRAHLDRVAAATDNLYQRFGVDTSQLRSYLARYRSDRARIETRKQQEGIDDIEGYLISQVINQEQAVQRVVPALRRMRSGLAEPGRLMGVFLFLGPTGVGKTELARAIAEAIFGPKPGARDPYLIKIDCGAFTEKRDIVQLLGAPQGLVGYKEGQLTQGLREKPRSVILFDEAEKANAHIWQSLLPFFDEGIVREADGTEYDATGCILVATSNLGYEDAMAKFNLLDVAPEDREATQQQVEQYIWSRVEEYFSPEFRGRFGRENVIFFNHFDQQSYEAIVRLQIGRLIEEMTGRGFKVSVPDSVIRFLGNLAWNRREEGARPVRRLINEHLRDQIVNAITDDPDRREFSFVVLEGSGRVVLAGVGEGLQANDGAEISAGDKPRERTANYDEMIGSLAGGRYRVEERIGAGAFGQVYRAKQEIFGIALRTVALKLFTTGQVTQGNAKEVFREALLLEAITAGARSQGKETHLTAIYDIGVLKDYQRTPFVAMEYVDGGSLADQLRKAERFTLPAVVRYLRDICAGLMLAHEASPVIVHRDLKPANVLITRSGFVKVADFGVAVDQYEAFFRGGGGTVTYAPPESRENAPAHPTRDVYSLGVMMVELLLGDNPLEQALRRAKEQDRPIESELERAQEAMAGLRDPATGRPFEEIIFELRGGEVSEGSVSASMFKEVLTRCLALSPAARFSGARALDSALAECQADTGRVIEENIESGAEKVNRLLRLARRSLGRGGADELARARKLFEEVRSLDERNAQACFGLSEVYEKLGRIDDAVREQKTGTEVARSRKSMKRLAELYERAGDIAEAKAARLIAETLAD